MGMVGLPPPMREGIDLAQVAELKAKLLARYILYMEMIMVGVFVIAI